MGTERAQRLIDDKLPVSAPRAAAIGLVDEVGPRHPDAYTAWLTELADRESDGRTARHRRAAKARRLAAERVPLEVYEARELAEMSRDTYGDRSGFAAARHAFVHKTRPAETPRRLRLPAAAAAPLERAGLPHAGPRPVVRPAIPMSA